MTKKTKQYGDDKKFVIATLSRGDVRMICGDAVADGLSDENMDRLVDVMTEATGGDSFVQDLMQLIEYEFPELAEKMENSED